MRKATRIRGVARRRSAGDPLPFSTSDSYATHKSGSDSKTPAFRRGLVTRGVPFEMVWSELSAYLSIRDIILGAEHKPNPSLMR